MKTKKRYVKPSVKVFELEQQPQLLVGSNTRSPYGEPIDLLGS